MLSIKKEYPRLTITHFTWFQQISQKGIEVVFLQPLPKNHYCTLIAITAIYRAFAGSTLTLRPLIMFWCMQLKTLWACSSGTSTKVNLS